ncbi:MAG: formylglycine-generating enzyme family protein [Saprospiraceae bacterium]|nr:formylglycine-generating enzyme family protein [Saprospiraceae bacterium]
MDDGSFKLAVMAQFKITGQQSTAGGTTPAQDPKAWVKKFDYEPDMVFVDGGAFTMGCTAEQGGECDGDEKNTRKVTLSGYFIAQHEVTQKQWREVMGSDPPELWNKGCDQCPVERVSWNDVQEFLKKLNQKTGRKYRLPTEAEWEYAARGGTKSKGFKYAGSNNLEEVAWYESNSGKKTRPVGGKKANELGLYDMSGNVWEWCSDWYGEYPTTAQTNPTGPATGSNRVYRGGSWGNSAVNCRVSLRGLNRGYSLGFRVASSPQ